MRVYRFSVLVSLAFAFPVAATCADQLAALSVEQSAGLVPDAETAIGIAAALWETIYGSESVKRQKPHTATLANGVWTVRGTRPKEFTKGGVAIAEIQQADGKILRVSHGR
jgi:hypothetical protein